MPKSSDEVQFHFLDQESEMSGEEFLKSNLSFMLDHFSYENLSGLSVSELNKKIDYYNFIRENIYASYLDSESMWAEPGFKAIALDGEDHLYEPLTKSQRMEIIRVCDQIRGNFDKAYEDAKDRKFSRIKSIINSITQVR